MNVASVDPRRVRRLNEIAETAGPVIYWMDRDRRADDNWALLYAAELANTHKQPLLVVYALPKTFLDATWRSYDALIRGLQETEQILKTYKIPFVVRVGEPVEVITKLVKQVSAGAVVTDFAALRLPRVWRAELTKKLPCAVFEVDAHNLVPCWLVSPKQEFAARTFRPKIHKLIPEFTAKPFPDSVTVHAKLAHVPASDSWKKVEAAVEVDRSIGAVDWFKPGEIAARHALDVFIGSRLSGYAKRRNDPNEKGQSDLSPYLHFGQLSAERVAWEVRHATAPSADKEAFLEELIVRRELSDNYCYYQPKYDQFEGLPEWGQRSLNTHRRDKRAVVYTLKQFETGKTHDTLWNAAQSQLVTTGKMHGYLRMYWAKKILEWTKTPEHAQRIAISLNDRYSLDGRDPNGYVGIAWSIGGLHDRPWFTHPVFGLVRYMNESGARKKFDVDTYIKKWTA